MSGAESLSNDERDDNPLGALYLTENEIHAAAIYAGTPMRTIDDYRRTVAGDVIRLASAPDHDPSGVPAEGADLLKLRIDIIEDATLVDEEYPTTVTPPSKAFEGTIVDTDGSALCAGDEVFGIFFPDGFISLVDSGARSDVTNRRIWAAIAHFGGDPDQ
jgi:hypothetical protein